MSYSYSSETKREIWNDQHGDCTEVGPDRDVADMVEIRHRDKEGKITNRMAFEPVKARLIAWALLECADEVEIERGG